MAGRIVGANDHPEPRNPDPYAVAAYLHTNNVIIVCDRDAWAIELTPPRSPWYQSEVSRPLQQRWSPPTQPAATP